jgi:hypothetical protein
MRPRIAFAVGVHWCPSVSAIQAPTRSNGSDRTSRNRHFRVHTAEVTGSKPVAPTTKSQVTASPIVPLLQGGVHWGKEFVWMPRRSVAVLGGGGGARTIPPKWLPRRSFRSAGLSRSCPACLEGWAVDGSHASRAGLRTSSHHCRNLVGVVFSGVRGSVVSIPWL